MGQIIKTIDNGLKQVGLNADKSIITYPLWIA